MSTINECKAIGRGFENIIADKLRNLGYAVYQDLYVPFKPGSDKYTQIDIVAVYNSTAITLECKYISGVVTGERYDKTWRWTNGADEHSVANFLNQSYCHRRALEDNLWCNVFEFVVISDSLQYAGPSVSYIIRESDIVPIFSAVAQKLHPVPLNTERLHGMLQSWCKPTSDILRDHLIFVMKTKNKGIAEAVQNLVGMPYYCLLINEQYFYSFTDAEGKHWGTEDIEEASLYESEDEAWGVSNLLPFNTELCTLELGGIELLRDVADEFEGMTPNEIANEIGARPW